MWFLRVHDSSWRERCCGEIGVKTTEKHPFTLYFNGICLFPCMFNVFAVSSATGLGVLLMATLFPVMVNVGISRGAAAAICASPISIILSPTSGDVVLSAEISKIPFR